MKREQKRKYKNRNSVIRGNQEDITRREKGAKNI